MYATGVRCVSLPSVLKVITPRLSFRPPSQQSSCDGAADAASACRRAWWPLEY